MENGFHQKRHDGIHKLYLLQNQINNAYEPLGSVECEATPVKDTYVFYNSNFYMVKL